MGRERDLVRHAFYRAIWRLAYCGNTIVGMTKQVEHAIAQVRVFHYSQRWPDQL